MRSEAKQDPRPCASGLMAAAASAKSFGIGLLLGLEFLHFNGGEPRASNLTDPTMQSSARKASCASRAASGSRLFSFAVRLRAPRAVAVAREAAPRIRATLEFEQDAGRERGVGEVGEHAVDAEPVKLQIFVHRGALVVRDQALLLVAEGPRVHQQADLVRALDQVACRQELAAPHGPNRAARGP